VDILEAILIQRITPAIQGRIVRCSGTKTSVEAATDRPGTSQSKSRQRRSKSAE
jgi:hypothetical protein